jgi:EAL domain-containing protein (putative c-di-GMP-specific phosphodiesterase class I)
VDAAVSAMRALRAQGLGLSLDDFGTGYSSLGYLRRLPLDQIKIDRDFVHDGLGDPGSAAVVRSIIGLADSLGLDVIAEGVETAAHHQFLLTHGCKAFQGYLFGRPMALQDFEEAAQGPLGPQADPG